MRDTTTTYLLIHRDFQIPPYLLIHEEFMPPTLTMGLYFLTTSLFMEGFYTASTSSPHRRFIFSIYFLTHVAMLSIYLYISTFSVPPYLWSVPTLRLPLHTTTTTLYSIHCFIHEGFMLSPYIFINREHIFSIYLRIHVGFLLFTHIVLIFSIYFLIYEGFILFAYFINEGLILFIYLIIKIGLNFPQISSIMKGIYTT
ncbi:hypothetical protein CDAR_308221 [Caerostris darwini]|uniref:Uncharacterized protein n=1 Tax=Caerostris darwini TaxID=1538125 RepID=A0AAV4S6T7_9ARAC|nr:hypothetical protein CDAR_308221 [Caerostris darwini]